MRTGESGSERWCGVKDMDDKKRRKYPAKINMEPGLLQHAVNTAVDNLAKPKRGRPKKIQVMQPEVRLVKRGRGRPPKGKTMTATAGGSQS